MDPDFTLTDFEQIERRRELGEGVDTDEDGIPVLYAWRIDWAQGTLARGSFYVDAENEQAARIHAVARLRPGQRVLSVTLA